MPGQDLIGNDGDEWLNSTYAITAWDLVLLAVALHHARVAARSTAATSPPAAS
jgi:hypothetical protein